MSVLIFILKIVFLMYNKLILIVKLTIKIVHGKSKIFSRWCSTTYFLFIEKSKNHIFLKLVRCTKKKIILKHSLITISID